MQFDWSWVVWIIATIALLLMAGKLKELVKETQEFVEAVVDALEDDRITKEELARCISEAKDVGMAAKNIVWFLLRR